MNPGLPTVLALVMPLWVFAGGPANGEQLTMAVVDDEELELIDEFAFLEDAGMIELASRHRQEIGMSPSAITVLTREDVEASGATTLPDLLRMVPGIDVVMTSPSYYSVSSRLFWNASNSYFQLLIDGRDCINEILGMTTWQAEIVSLEDIERIEILRGPASSMYGASAFAGVVSVTTRLVPEKTSASVRIAGGEVGMLQAGGRASTRIGGWGFALYAATDQLNSFFQPRLEGNRSWKLRAMAEYEWSETKRFLIDFGMSNASGTMNTSVGLVDMTLIIRALRLAYESENLRGRLYWLNAPADVSFEAPLEFGGLTLAEFIPMKFDTHTVDGEVQWTLPELTDKLLLMVGGGGRVTYIASDQALDGETYADITSPDYHQPGITHWEGRAGAFVHSEYQPAEWITLSGSLRFDYNTITPAFLSPRMVAVFKPAKGQYLRMGLSRAFRKSAYIETGLHPMVSFPADSPITGPAQDNFLEFMSKSIGNPDLDNEEQISFEAGYLGLYLDGSLSVALDIYFSQFRNGTGLSAEIVADAQGLPDLDESLIRVSNDYGDFDLYGSELVVRYNPSRQVSLMASWAYRELFDRTVCCTADSTPKNMFTLGGRFRTDQGLLGSLYVFSRSEFMHRWVENPEGLFAPALTAQLENVFLIMAKLGWKWRVDDLFDVETGLKIFLPFSPFSGDLFSYYEDAGGETPYGRPYGGEALRRVVSAYLQGSF